MPPSMSRGPGSPSRAWHSMGPARWNAQRLNASVPFPYASTADQTCPSTTWMRPGPPGAWEMMISTEWWPMQASCR